MSITEQMAEKSFEVLKTAITVANNEIPKVTAEFINYLIFSESLGIFRNIIIYLLALQFARYLSCHVSITQEELASLKSEEQRLQKEKQTPAIDYELRQLGYNKRDKTRELQETKFFRNISIIIPTVILILFTSSNLSQVGKLLIAPKVFLLQEGMSLLKPNAQCPEKGK